MLRDEYRYLLPGDERVARIAKNALLFEEYIAQLADRGELTLEFEDSRANCCCTATVTSAPWSAPGLPCGRWVCRRTMKSRRVDSGCCGMAGSFGYESEHYDLSLKMAERRLLPAVRDAAADTLIVAAGTSCRHQILHGSGRQALHPAEVLRAAMHSHAAGETR